MELETERKGERVTERKTEERKCIRGEERNRE